MVSAFVCANNDMHPWRERRCFAMRLAVFWSAVHGQWRELKPLSALRFAVFCRLRVRVCMPFGAFAFALWGGAAMAFVLFRLFCTAWHKKHNATFWGVIVDFCQLRVPWPYARFVVCSVACVQHFCGIWITVG